MLRDLRSYTLALTYSKLAGVYCYKVAFVSSSGAACRILFTHVSFAHPFDLAGSLKFGRLSLRPHVAVRNFCLVQPKKSGGETLFAAKLTTIESPLSGLFSGML